MTARPLDPPLLFDLPVGPDFSIEIAAFQRGSRHVAGCDEAGRGPLAGPVVAAAVVFERDRIPEGLDDSKKLTRAQREVLFAEIMAVAEISVASSSPRSIDRIDIRKASLDAMRRALAGLPLDACHALFDGRDVPHGIACSGAAVVKGDARSFSIAAASIVAKVMRDRMMARLDTIYPAYGFAQHVGYATSAHRQAIALLGPCPIHRMSFRPMRPDGV